MLEVTETQSKADWNDKEYKQIEPKPRTLIKASNVVSLWFELMSTVFLHISQDSESYRGPPHQKA